MVETMTIRMRAGGLCGHGAGTMGLVLPLALCACNSDDGTPISTIDGTETGQDDDDDDGESTFSTVTVTVTTPTTDCPTTDCSDVTTDPTITTTPTTTPTTDSETDTETTGPMPGWPDPGVFGDDVQEVDLVGTWTMPWDPSEHWDSTLYVYDNGYFEWIEWSAGCEELTYVAGSLWVEGTQIVMHVDAWERPLPWATEDVIGQSFPPPFRLRLGYTVLGEYLAFAAPPGITAQAAYAGRSYLLIEDGGEALAGTWVAEAELHAIPDGESSPFVIVRDRYEAYLDAPFPGTSEGTGARQRIQTYYYPEPPQMTDPIYEGGNWQDLNPGQSAGAALVDGNEQHAYGPSYGATQLMSWTAETSFRLGVASDCEL
jgi:hypothetical protein